MNSPFNRRDPISRKQLAVTDVPGARRLSPPAVKPAADVESDAVDEDAGASRWMKPFLALKEKEFRNLWLGMLPGTMGMQMGMITNGYLAYDLTGSAAAIGFVTLGFGVPMLLFALIGGVVADRVSKRRVIMITQAIIGLCAVALAVLVLTGLISIWLMTAVAFVMGTCFAFNMPARQSFVAEIISRKRLMNAIALNNAGMNMSRVVGPALAGFLIGKPWVGIGGIYILMACMYAFVVASLFRVRDRGASPNPGKISGYRSLLDGLSYIKGNSVVLALLMLAFAPVILGMPYQALMPVFAEDVFNVGASGLGWLLAVNGIGALLGSLGVASMSGASRRGLIQLGLGVTFGASIAIFAFSTRFEVALLALLVVGASSAAYMALNSTLVMDKAEPEYHGRVMSVYMLTFSAMPLAVTPFGAMSDAFGAPLVIGIGGLMLVAVVAVFGTLHPSYRHLK
ncbi:MAG: MFS transporter [Chloroflexia bacterium]|nr:MFS transporter [Chloroflexia bacterium]